MLPPLEITGRPWDRVDAAMAFKLMNSSAWLLSHSVLDGVNRTGPATKTKPFRLLALAIIARIHCGPGTQSASVTKTQRPLAC